MYNPGARGGSAMKPGSMMGKMGGMSESTRFFGGKEDAETDEENMREWMQHRLELMEDPDPGEGRMMLDGTENNCIVHSG